MSDEQVAAEAPLAARMRPRTLAEFAGQEHIIGPGTVLRAAVEGGQLFSMILFGPPGCGKTTLARLIAAETGARLVQLSAVSSGTADVRAAIKGAREARTLSAARTVLFIDEIHRFNKAQQDALLPAIEDGIVTLIGATTENPYFEVNSALLSRCQLYRFEPLTPELVEQVVTAALQDEERGLGGRGVTLGDGALAFLAGMSRGDARVALNALETAWRSRSAASPGAPVKLTPRRSAGRGAEVARHVRPRGCALRHHLGVHQEHARQRPGRGGLLSRLHDRRRRGPQVHRAPHDRLRQRGRRQRRPAGAAGGDRRRARRGVRGPARVSHQPEPGGDLPGAGAQEQRRLQGGGRGPRRRAPPGQPAAAASSARRELPRREGTRPRRGVQVPARERRLGQPAVPARPALRAPLLRADTRDREPAGGSLGGDPAAGRCGEGDGDEEAKRS